MILNTDNSISRYYAESLVLLFFPGVKFPENEVTGDSVTFHSEIKDNIVTGYAKISALGSIASGEYTIDYVDKNSIQRAVGGAMLNAGEKLFGVVPPWGMMTGVRPAKTALKYLKKYNSYDDAFQKLKDDYLCSDSKLHLALKTAQSESAFINEQSKKTCSLYIAIPFCPSKCSYCSFTSFSSPRLLSLIPSYLERLCIDLQNTVDLINEIGLSIETVYIGGGTPTTLEADALSVLLKTLSNSIKEHNVKELTVEAGRPDTITKEKLSVLKEYNVSRISVNCQTLNDEILSAIGRKHTSDDFLKTYEMAVKSGIPSINVDLIAGLPGETLDSFKYSVDKVLTLDPSNVTVHTFYAKRAAEIVKKDFAYNIKNDIAIDAVNYADSEIMSKGYLPYYLYKQKNTTANLENTGFAKPGYECLYNVYMMEEVHTVFGVGASSMTKLVSQKENESKIVRLSETKYPYEYLDGEKNDAEKRIKYLRENTIAFYEN